MSIEKVRAYLNGIRLADRIMEFSQSSATVELAAQALGCEPARIAKTMSFLLGEETILILTAGDAKVDNRKYKDTFHTKAKMIPREDVERLTGHAPGGVCPFAVPETVRVYLDVSLKPFDVVYPAAGSGNSAVRLTVDELEKASGSVGWVDVCKEPQTSES